MNAFLLFYVLNNFFHVQATAVEAIEGRENVRAFMLFGKILKRILRAVIFLFNLSLRKLIFNG